MKEEYVINGKALVINSAEIEKWMNLIGEQIFFKLGGFSSLLFSVAL